MTWSNININPDLPNHPKLIELEARVGDTALSHIIRLWCWVAAYAPDGSLAKHQNSEYLESQVMKWKGKKGELVDAMIQTGWIDRNQAKKLSIHDWADWNPHVAPWKERQFSRAHKRWEREKEREYSPGQSGGEQKNAPEVSEQAIETEAVEKCHPSINPSLPSNIAISAISPGQAEAAHSTDDDLTKDLACAFFRRTFDRDPSIGELTRLLEAERRFGVGAGAWEDAFDRAQNYDANSLNYVLKTVENLGNDEDALEGADDPIAPISPQHLAAELSQCDDLTLDDMKLIRDSRPTCDEWQRFQETGDGRSLLRSVKGRIKSSKGLSAL